MSLSTSDIKHLAHLARLAIEEPQIESLAGELDNIMHLVEQMNSVNTDKIQPLAHPLDETQPMREDEITEINQRNEFQKIAPQISAGLYIVPQVIGQE